MTNIKEIIQRFIEDLESKILSLEKDYHDLEQEREDYEYSQMLLEVLDKSKRAFIEGVITGSEEQQQRFDSFIKKTIKNPNEIDRIYEEAMNLYYLIEYNLYDEEVSVQRGKASDALGSLLEGIKTYHGKVNEEELEKKEETISTNINTLIEIGSAFNNNELETNIKDIETFSTVLEESTLTSEEKEEFLLYMLKKESILYQESLNSRKSRQPKETEIVIDGSKELEEMFQVEEEKEETIIKR